MNVIQKKFCVLQKKVLSFGPNRTVEVRPNQTFGRSLKQALPELIQYATDMQSTDKDQSDRSGDS